MRGYTDNIDNRSHTSNLSGESKKPYTDQLDLEQAIRLRVQEIWHNYDEDGSGHIELNEFKQACKLARAGYTRCRSDPVSSGLNRGSIGAQ